MAADHPGLDNKLPYFCSRADGFMKLVALVAKYRFSCMSNSIKHVTSTSGMSKWLNSRWLPTWQPKGTSKSIYGHNSGFRATGFRADSLMKLVAKYRFSHVGNSNKYNRITPDMPKWANPRWPSRWSPKSVYCLHFWSRADNWMKQTTITFVWQIAVWN